MDFIEMLRQLLAKPFRALTYYTYGHKERYSSIELCGSKEFCLAVKEALSFLKEQDISMFDLTVGHIRFILQSRIPFLRFFREGTTLGLEEEIKDASFAWLACLLAYYAYRAKLYENYKKQHQKTLEVPSSVYSPDKAYDFMYDRLEKIGGTYEQLQCLKEFIEKEQQKAASN